MRLIIHAGANKAGSTSLQNWFCTHRNEMQRQGVLWPQTGLLHGAHYEISQRVGFGQSQSDLGVEIALELRDALHQEASSVEADTVVISSEYFILNRSLEKLARFCEGFSVEVVFALRRHDYWWPSLWSQAVRTAEAPPWDRTFESYFAYQTQSKNQHFNYRNLIEKWEQCFPGAVRAIAFEPQWTRNGIVSQFLSATWLETLDIPNVASDLALNESPSADVLALVDTIQREATITRDQKMRLISWASNLQGAAKKPWELLSGNTRCKLIAPHLADYAYLGKRFGDAEGMFFREPLPLDDEISGPHGLPTDEALALLIRLGKLDIT